MEKLSKFLDDKRPKKSKKLSTFFYFLIIRLEEFHKNFENIFTMYIKYGLTFLVFLYAEKDKIIPYKNTFNFIFQTIFVDSPEDILYYLSQKLKFEHPSEKISKEEIGDIFKIKIPKITFEQMSNDNTIGSSCFAIYFGTGCQAINIANNSQQIVHLRCICSYVFYV